PVSGAAEAGLDFIEDEKGAGFGAALANGLEVAGGRELDAAFALDGFDDDGGDGFVDLLQGGVIGVWKELYVCEDAGELVTEVVAAEAGECADGVSVVGVCEGDEVVTTGGFDGKFEGGVIGFGAGGEEVCA